MADMVIGNNLLSIYSTYAEHYTIDARYLSDSSHNAITFLQKPKQLFRIGWL